ncbi:MAG: complex I subunit 1 family protein [Bdellovibrionota bacterium]
MGLDLGFGPIEVNDFLVQFVATLIKIAVVIGGCLQIPPLMIWLERRGPALMQRRRGPNRVGIEIGFIRTRLWGLMQVAADTVKLIFKEEVVPAKAYKFWFQVAPMFGVFPAMLMVAAIPFGNDLVIGGYRVPLSIINLDVGFLFILAMSGIGVYGVTLAGWASANKFSLLGSLRASAQMISYEIPLGLALVPMVLVFGTFDLNEICMAQDTVLNWGVFRGYFIVGPLSLMLFIISMFAETNRAPFDLAEGESELVAGFHTEYNSAKFAAFFLAEYIAMFVLSCLCSIFFFGGWQIPFLPYDALVELTGSQNIASLLGVGALLLKAAFFMWFYVWVRWTLPRFRYDQLMNLGWKFMLPTGLANVFFAAFIMAMATF